MGTIIAIHKEEDMWYIGCRSCRKKAMRSQDMIDLEADMPKKVLLVKMIGGAPSAMSFQDETGTISFTLWNDEGEQNDQFSTEITALIGKKYAFKVSDEYNVKKLFLVFIVLRLSDDPEILDYICVSASPSKDLESHADKNTTPVNTKKNNDMDDVDKESSDGKNKCPAENDISNESSNGKKKAIEELFMWNPIFLAQKEVVYSSENESIHGEENKTVQQHLSEESGDDVRDVEGVAETNFDSNSASHMNYSGDKDKQHSEDLFGLKDTVQDIGDIDRNFFKESSPVINAKVMNNFQSVQEEEIFYYGQSAAIKGGSVLGVLEEVIRVGQAMGYSMEGCEKDTESIIRNQGDDAENFNYDYVCSDSLGNSGGILCIWEATVFKKEYVTISDNFVAIYGTWLPNNSRILFVAVYAPQQVSSKRVLWDYMSVLLSRWNGEVIMMGDFNEVRSRDEGRGRWIIDKRFHIARSKIDIISELQEIDKELDQGVVSDVNLLKRLDLNRQLHDINEAFHDHFEAQFKKPITNRLKLNFPFNKRLLHDQAADLERRVSRDEIRMAVWNCEENKSPGPDGFTFEFLGDTGISLVRISVMDAKFINDYRPISLIRSVYKVVTKILANRLAVVIANIIFDTRSAFIAERQILDGPFILNEVLHWCKRKNKKAMFFKVDFAKAYDSVRWDYLIDVLEAFGFGPTWCKWIQGTFYFAKASVLVNGSPSNEFQFHRGLKKEWADVVLKLRSRLSKWKVKTLSIGGRLTLLKSVLGASPLYTMSIFKVSRGVLKEMEAIRNQFFNGADPLDKKITWVDWIRDGNNIRFWSDIWKGDRPLKEVFPRVFALELDKEILVAEKVATSIDHSFRRPIRSVVEQQQRTDLALLMDFVSLSSSQDRWVCDLSGDGEFRVKEIRNYIDDMFLPVHPEPTRWVQYTPIKVNVFAWRARRDCLPTRVQLIRRGVTLESTNCPLCRSCEEDIHHVLFRCDVARTILCRVCRWWDLDWQARSSFADWNLWFSAIRLSSKVKCLLEGVFCVAWWSIWLLRNRTIFDDNPPSRSAIFDDIVSFSFNWCHNRCNQIVFMGGLA
uniref:RNA-directed DNA polymerase, eukaryota n=1 Tax=Tanacetum cinerariifolium TaxID=118510 RepID=A0A6L2LJS5_TANCI|nr:RNA-directed DNA polymerase, eukaryota [Tanacetum cinerariifolium]